MGVEDSVCDFVDLVRAICSPCVTFPECVDHFAEPDSARVDIWAFWKFSLALAMGWSNTASTSFFTYSSKTLFSISLVKTPSNWDANVSSFSVVGTDPVSVVESRIII